MNPRTRPPDSQPVTIPGYEVLDTLGTGGFSVVYRARQLSMHREVAVKVLNSGFSSDEAKRLFERECHALGRLAHHPNIVTVFNTAMTDDGRPCIVMELLEATYRERLDVGGPLPAEEVMATGVRIAGALQAVHDAGILHRDLKPSNMFQSAYGEPALGDFGISTVNQERTQTVMGALSVAYAAPEVVEDGVASARSDVYSLAASLYQLVTGEAPFKSPQLSTTLRRILTEPPKSIALVRVPPELDDLLRHALAKDPADRPASALEFAGLLRGVQGRAGFERTTVPQHIGARSANEKAPSVPLAPPPADDTYTSATIARRVQKPAPPPAPVRTRRHRMADLVSGVGGRRS